LKAWYCITVLSAGDAVKCQSINQPMPVTIEQLKNILCN